MQASSERLPWLADEPSSATKSTVSPRPVAGAQAMWPWYLILLLLVGAVAAGLWWLGTEQQDAPPPELAAEQSLPIPAPRPLPAEEASEALNQAVSEPTAEEGRASPAPPRAPEVAVRRPQAEPRLSAPRQSAPAEQSEPQPSRGVFPADEPVAAPPITGPRPVVVYHPNPNRGRVVQLGAFPTRAQAEESWRRVTRRYPYLATKPKMVNTVDVRGLGRRSTRMYRLQLGTSSQAQSVVICQQLERAGQSCVVVY